MAAAGFLQSEQPSVEAGHQEEQWQGKFNLLNRLVAKCVGNGEEISSLLEVEHWKICQISNYDVTGNTPIFDSAALFAVPGISTVTVSEIGGAGPGY